jgi:hypothetical protein
VVVVVVGNVGDGGGFRFPYSVLVVFVAVTMYIIFIVVVNAVNVVVLVVNTWWYRQYVTKPSYIIIVLRPHTYINTKPINHHQQHEHQQPPNQVNPSTNQQQIKPKPPFLSSHTHNKFLKFVVVFETSQVDSSRVVFERFWSQVVHDRLSDFSLDGTELYV